jgi:hypothetical protein
MLRGKQWRRGSVTVDFLELSPGKRRRLVAHVRDAILEQGGLDPDPDFSSPSRTWVERMESALADTNVSQSSFDQLARPYEAYLETLPREEREALQLRLAEFIRVRDALLEASA